MATVALPVALRSQAVGHRVPSFVELDLRDVRAHVERCLAMLALKAVDQRQAGELASGPISLASTLRFDQGWPNTDEQRVYARLYGPPCLLVRLDGTCTLDFAVDESDDRLRCVVAPEQFVPPLRPMWHFVPQMAEADHAIDALVA